MATGTVHNHIFFTNILRLLDERGMTKNELAAKADISVSFPVSYTHLTLPTSDLV